MSGVAGGLHREIPAGLGTLAVAVFVGLGVVALAGLGWLTTAVGVVGVLAIAAGYPLESTGLATVGGALLYLTVLVGGAAGLESLSVVVAGAGAFLAWTFARTAAGLRHDLGEAPSGPLELTHVAGTTTLALAGVVVAYVPYLLGESDLPPLALTAFVVGAVLLTVSLRDTDQ